MEMLKLDSTYIGRSIHVGLFTLPLAGPLGLKCGRRRPEPFDQEPRAPKIVVIR